MVALVDDCDYDSVNSYKWHAQKMQGDIWYAARADGGKFVRMHRIIMSVSDRKICVDHINHNGLDNRRGNLRTCTHAQNLANSRKKKGKNRFKGISERCGNFRAIITLNGKLKSLGTYKNEQDAVSAYNSAVTSMHGEFAFLNDIDQPNIIAEGRKVSTPEDVRYKGVLTRSLGLYATHEMMNILSTSKIRY